MKESTLATKVMIGVLCAGVLLYLALYFILGFEDELATTIAYQDSVNVGTEATAILVRDEVVLSSSGTYVDMVLSEGEKAAAGSTVALIYDNLTALDTRRKIRHLESEIEQLEYALTVGTQTVDSSRLDQQVINSIISLRALTAKGDLSSLDDSVLNLRTMVFQRDYTYGDTGAADDIKAMITQKKEQLSQLNRSLNRVSQAVIAPVSGVFSGQADGYEKLITPDMLDSITLTQLDELLRSDSPDQPNAAGKLITDSTWYMAAIFEGSNELSLREGRSYTVSFSHDYYGEVKAKLERIVVEDGRTMAIFSSRTKLSDTTLLRIQTVDIVVNEITGIRIPRKALRVKTESVTDEHGVTTQVNTYGVYTVVNTQAEWQSVNVLYTGTTYYLVEPVNKSSQSRLREGDIIILTSSDMYDGKVVR